MKKRETVYICDLCRDFTFGYPGIKTTPNGWTKLGKEHLCPKCSKIYQKLKEEIDNE